MDILSPPLLLVLSSASSSVAYKDGILGPSCVPADGDELKTAVEGEGGPHSYCPVLLLLLVLLLL